jgi:ubiquinone biosynthesis protein UbiJ
MLASSFQWLGPAALARLVLLLNHVVSSEPQAAARLKPHAGRPIDIRWRAPATAVAGLPPFLAAWLPQDLTPPPIRLTITPAGLFEAVPLDTPIEGSGTATLSGLTLTVNLGEPLDTLKRLSRGERPDVQIEGDAALAEVASWLMKNLRWDVQDDVARWLGTPPAELLRKVGDGIREALLRWRPSASASGSPPR